MLIFSNILKFEDVNSFSFERTIVKILGHENFIGSPLIVALVLRDDHKRVVLRPLEFVHFFKKLNEFDDFVRFSFIKKNHRWKVD